MSRIFKLNDNRFINTSRISHALVSEDNTTLHIWFTKKETGGMGELVLRGNEGAIMLEYLNAIAFQPHLTKEE